jgi:hypothetical protein
MDRKPLYRPDKLGVIFQRTDVVLAMFEVVPGALQTPTVQYIKGRLAGGRIVRNYPVGVLDGIRFDPDTVEGDMVPLDPTTEWEVISEKEMTLRRKTSRVPLPLAA